VTFHDLLSAGCFLFSKRREEEDSGQMNALLAVTIRP